MRTLRWQQFIQHVLQAGAAIAVAMVFGLGSVRASTAPALVFDPDELAAFNIDEADLFPRQTIAEPQQDADTGRLLSPQPADMADVETNLVPLPAPLVPAAVGVFVVTARFVMRRRSATAGVFRVR
jgi:hypothetical protein